LSLFLLFEKTRKDDDARVKSHRIIGSSSH